MKTFVQELKTRRVYRVAIAYLVAGSAIVQLAGTVFPTFHAPEWMQQVFVVLVAVCFPVALGLAWTFDLRGGGIKERDRTGPGRKQTALWVLLVLGSFIALSALTGCGSGIRGAKRVERAATRRCPRRALRFAKSER